MYKAMARASVKNGKARQAFRAGSLSVQLSPVILLSILASAPRGHAEEAPGTSGSPWAFNLSLYTWITGITGNFSAGPLSRSVDASFIDLAENSRRFPIGFMGRFEAHYERLGAYLDGNYMSLAFDPKFQRVGSGVDTELGLMDYGLMYRLVGPTADEAPTMHGERRPNRLDVYAGARTLWLDNSFTLTAPGLGLSRTFTMDRSFTSPQIGGRFIVDITHDLFLLTDANLGGFGADGVSFTGGVLGMLGYRLNAGDLPLSIQAGYKALRYEVNGGERVPIRTRATLNGPFLGLTAYW